MSTQIPQLSPNASPMEILRAGIEAAQGPVSLACSFSLEDVAIIDIAHGAGLKLGVFALDTGRLNEETYEVADAITERYRVTIDWFFPRTRPVGPGEHPRAGRWWWENPEQKECGLHRR